MAKRRKRINPSKKKLEDLAERLRQLGVPRDQTQVDARRMGEYGINPSGTQGARSRRNVRQVPGGELALAAGPAYYGFVQPPSGSLRGPTHNNPLVLGFRKSNASKPDPYTPV